jgi:hypothetical protein
MYSAEFFPSFCDQIKTKLGPCKQACDLVAEHCGTHVVAEFAKYQKLKRLDLYNKGLTTEEVLCITNGLMYQTSITALDLRKNEMDQESGGQAVINVLNRNQRIIELNGINIEGKSTIDCREMERQGFELFEASFLGNRMLQSATLTSVNLSWCSLRKNGTRMLANGLGECMKLRHIDLAGNYMGVIGAGLIANAIRQVRYREPTPPLLSSPLLSSPPFPSPLLSSPPLPSPLLSSISPSRSDRNSTWSRSCSPTTCSSGLTGTVTATTAVTG